MFALSRGLENVHKHTMSPSKMCCVVVQRSWSQSSHGGMIAPLVLLMLSISASFRAAKLRGGTVKHFMPKVYTKASEEDTSLTVINFYKTEGTVKRARKYAVAGMKSVIYLLKE